MITVSFALSGNHISRMLTLEQKVGLAKNIIEKAVSDYQKIFFSFSGGKDSTVMLDLVFKAKPDIKIVGIDTGYEFPETIEFTDKLMKKYGTEIEYLRPDNSQKLAVWNHHGWFSKIDGEQEPTANHVMDGQWMCCAMKEPALKNFL